MFHIMIKKTIRYVPGWDGKKRVSQLLFEKVIQEQLLKEFYTEIFFHCEAVKMRCDGYVHIKTYY